MKHPCAWNIGHMTEFISSDDSFVTLLVLLVSIRVDTPAYHEAFLKQNRAKGRYQNTTQRLV